MDDLKDVEDFPNISLYGRKRKKVVRADEIETPVRKAKKTKSEGPHDETSPNSKSRKSTPSKSPLRQEDGYQEGRILEPPDLGDKVEDKSETKENDSRALEKNEEGEQEVASEGVVAEECKRTEHTEMSAHSESTEKGVPKGNDISSDLKEEKVVCNPDAPDDHVSTESPKKTVKAKKVKAVKGEDTASDGVHKAKRPRKPRQKKVAPSKGKGEAEKGSQQRRSSSPRACKAETDDTAEAKSIENKEKAPSKQAKKKASQKDDTEKARKPKKAKLKLVSDDTEDSDQPLSEVRKVKKAKKKTKSDKNLVDGHGPSGEGARDSGDKKDSEVSRTAVKTEKPPRPKKSKGSKTKRDSPKTDTTEIQNSESLKDSVSKGVPVSKKSKTHKSKPAEGAEEATKKTKVKKSKKAKLSSVGNQNQDSLEKPASNVDSKTTLDELVSTELEPVKAKPTKGKKTKASKGKECADAEGKQKKPKRVKKKPQGIPQEKIKKAENRTDDAPKGSSKVMKELDESKGKSSKKMVTAEVDVKKLSDHDISEKNGSDKADMSTQNVNDSSFENELAGDKGESNQENTDGKVDVDETIKRFKCVVCDYRNKWKFQIRKHERTHGRFTCGLCETVFKTLVELDAHTKEQHPDKGKKGKKGASHEEKSRAVPKATPDMGKDGTEMSENEADLEESTNECKETVSHESSGGASSSGDDTGSKEGASGGRGLACPECGKHVKFACQLKLHMKVHDTTMHKEFACEFCEYRSHYKVSVNLTLSGPSKVFEVGVYSLENRRLPKGVVAPRLCRDEGKMGVNCL